MASSFDRSSWTQLTLGYRNRVSSWYIWRSRGIRIVQGQLFSKNGTEGQTVFKRRRAKRTIGHNKWGNCGIGEIT